MKKTMGAVLILAAAAIGAAPQAADRRMLTDQSRLLDRELALAKANKSYLYVDLPAGRIELRIQGLVLKTWPVAEYSQWGRALPSGSFKLEKKDALRTPKRKNITPGAEKEKGEELKSNELEVLEVKDMPGHFNLNCEGGITLRFKSSTGRLFRKLGRGVGSLGRSIYLPLKTLLAAVKKTDFTDVQFNLASETDAQSLYWAAEEGMSVLVMRK
jgi:hypothetical protein